ncbi:MAG: ABC transporter permease [Chloroflexi bacterium]|jgi:peptide/nickel transport system permease protein|uniref:ABC transporter permease n=1 Tax=Candidatus Thermofonsia Clade 3 bacterium TaxID=2364212 RepID=A0A2M8QBZ3_9CHLR|nr:ABC transporter permease [Candidatus Roseilinea sp. NK_OTU-006]PJF47300.1 MAG: ABC transporter permease [Candidatus Thermofonsia Clade 3 bacterium]RMG63035.1 MAG: ABC transporter permease [Chloroflexota bacterium]
MWQFMLRRLSYALLAVFVISLVSFAVIQLPPGDYVTDMINRVRATGGKVDPEFEQRMREVYGFNQPMIVQYAKWLTNILTRGEFGYSFIYKRDAGEMIMERLPTTAVMVFGAVLLTWLIALPLGVMAAVYKRTVIDYSAIFIGFVGLAVPSFMLAIVVLFVVYRTFGRATIGLFSPEYVAAPWSVNRLLDLLKNMWLPALITAVTGIGALTQTMRANLLDELNKPYVNTARAKGLPEWRLLWKYPVRHALNPFVSTIGWLLPALVAGDVVISIVLNLPTAGSMLYAALLQQDQYVAAGFILLLSSLTVIGTLISDLLLALLDPRIRLS